MFFKKKLKDNNGFCNNYNNFSHCVDTMGGCGKATIEGNRRFFNTGIGRKIVDIKASYSMNNALVFENDKAESFYHKNEFEILKAIEYMIAFSQGFLILGDGNSLNYAVGTGINEIQAFSLENIVFNEKFYYLNNTQKIDPSRIIAFNYHEDVGLNRFLSEFDLIGKEIKSDEALKAYAIEALKKNATVFYKIKGFVQQAMATPSYFQGLLARLSQTERTRSVYGASVVDMENEDVVSLSQSLPNLKDCDDISLRRLAMVSRIPLPMLIGENVQGLNSSGNVESEIFDDMIKQIQHRFLKRPLNSLFNKLGFGSVDFKENHRDSLLEKLQQQQLIIQNAQALQDLGLSSGDYIDSFNDILQIEVKK